MIIEPNIKMNVSFNAHPLGMKAYILEQANELKQLPQFDGPKTALIIGGSTGYGLATRLALGLNAKTNIINLSYETAPTDKRTGSAGYWNNIFANELLSAEGVHTKDFLGDAFADETKERVGQYIKDNFGKIDLVIYSLASGKRKDPKTSIMHSSTLKVIGTELTGYAFDLNTKTLAKRTIAPATETDIANTVKVMGGEDWQLWIDYLLAHDLVAENFKTIAYSYIGPEATKRIYREGTIGKAKEHLEKTAHELNHVLEQKVHGHAATAVCKAAITRASAVIPVVPIYGAALMKVMEEKGIEELPHQHIYRLLHDMVYGNKPEIDDAKRYRPDMWEMRTDVQAEVQKIMEQITPENVNELVPTDKFVQLFLEQNGFGFTNIDYTQDIDINALLIDNPIEMI
jgi:Uncharacterized paraquat-inducible protein B